MRWKCLVCVEIHGAWIWGLKTNMHPFSKANKVNNFTVAIILVMTLQMLWQWQFQTIQRDIRIRNKDITKTYINNITVKLLASHTHQ